MHNWIEIRYEICKQRYSPQIWPLLNFYIQWNPVKNFLKSPGKSYFLSGKFLKRVRSVMLIKWKNFGAFLSWLLRREIFLTEFFLSEFYCIQLLIYLYLYTHNVLWICAIQYLDSLRFIIIGRVLLVTQKGWNLQEKNSKLLMFSYKCSAFYWF
jgi:hypothetical protein